MPVSSRFPFACATLVLFVSLAVAPRAKTQENQFNYNRKVIALQPVLPKGAAATHAMPGQLSAAASEQVSNSSLPILIPGGVPGLTFSGGRASYSVGWVDNGIHFELEGSRVAYAYEGVEFSSAIPKETVEGNPAILSDGDGFRDVSWHELGIAYVLTQDCEDSSDARCKSTDSILKAANALIYAGGGLHVADLGEGKSERAPQFVAVEPGFTYDAPGGLLPHSGRGVPDKHVYAPGIRFPLQAGPAYANSQVWNPGGDHGPPGSQCDKGNYSYPWRDNFCEARDRATPMCPAGKGHQGQDIRPASCKKDFYDVVAVTNGEIFHVGSYGVYLRAPDGTQFRYLHMSHVQVVEGQQVKRGDVLGKVSNIFPPSGTTIHLHFEIMQNVASYGFTHVSPYASLVEAYKALP